MQVSASDFPRDGLQPPFKWTLACGVALCLAVPSNEALAQNNRAEYRKAAVSCVADTQCRGDAQDMCALSTLKIDVLQDGAYQRLWIDHQGPYAATLDSGETPIWRIDAFGGRHTLSVRPDMTFTYLGNRGKRFTGTCKGDI